MSHEPLRKAREDAGISLSGMARIIGWDKGNLSRVESGLTKGRKVPEAAMLYDIALGNEPYTLVRQCGAVPATLSARLDGAIPGWLSCLPAIPDRRPLFGVFPSPIVAVA